MVGDPYLSLRNYTNMLRKGSPPCDIADRGSGKLIDSLVLHGTPWQVLDGLRTHRASGADHVAIQVLASPGETPLAGFRALAGRLHAAAVELPKTGSPRPWANRVSGSHRSARRPPGPGLVRGRAVHRRPRAGDPVHPRPRQSASATSTSPASPRTGPPGAPESPGRSSARPTRTSTRKIG